MKFKPLLELGRWDDLETDISGWRAIRRVDIAPMAYEIKINAPLEGRRLQLVVDFAKPVKSEYEIVGIFRVGEFGNGQWP